MTKVVLVSLKYPAVYSGYGKQLKSITEEIVKNTQGISFTVITGYKESLESIKPGIGVISLLDKNDDQDSKSVFPFSRKVFRWLLTHKNEYDVIHCVKAGPEAMACNLASKILRKPLIVKVAQDELSDREISSAKGLKRQTRLLRHRLLSNVDHFIAISKEIESNLKARIGDKTVIHRIPNGVDTEKFFPVDETDKKALRQKLNISEDERVLLYTGAINKRKGIVDLLDALKMYDSHDNLKVIMCGPVLEDINFDERVSNLNNKDNLIIDYRGKVSNVDEFMKAADMFILPSYSEGLPNVLLEAASTGLPLIATDIGGSRDLVDDGVNGYIVNTGSSSEIANKVAALAGNDEKRRRFGQASREKICRSFSLNLVQSKYTELYQSISKKKN